MSKGFLMRRGAVLVGLGINQKDMTDIIRRKLLVPVPLRPGAKAYFVRAEVEAFKEKLASKKLK